MKLQYQLVDGGTKPTQGYEGDVAHDTYVRESTFVVGGSLSATKIPLGIKTAFDHDKYAVLVSPRGSFSKLPLALANSVGLVEGTYRGEYLALVRANLIASGLSEHVITLDDNGDLVAQKLDEALNSIPDAVNAVEKAKALFLKDSEVMKTLVGRDIPKDVLEKLFDGLVPTGTVLIKKDTRLVQIWAVPKQTIELVNTTLDSTVRGEGSVGSSGTNNSTNKGTK